MSRERRLSFGEVAELYDRARPSYPAALVDDLVVIAQLGPGRRALEVGAGTGKATTLLAARGAEVVALEPSPEMAAVARRRCARYPDVEIEEVEFEHWQPGGRRFALVYSAQAWHWISPAARYCVAGEALVAGGTLAAFWNYPDWDVCELRDELRDAYRRTAPESLVDGPMNPGGRSPSERWSRWADEIAASARFASPEVRRYRSSREYSTAEYVALLRTHSDHLILADSTREALLSAVAGVLDADRGKLALTYVTSLCLARARCA
ncbi:MAG: class I SAM-dependent methyltransferase [Solirubrobacteraceae bacterium]|jgi:SAM-dependent methyltransferase